jgi:hypothetical protein
VSIGQPMVICSVLCWKLCLKMCQVVVLGLNSLSPANNLITIRYLPFIFHYYIHTSVHSHVFTSRCLVADSNGGRSRHLGFRTIPVPQLPASHSNSSQGLNPSSPLTNSLTHQPTQLNSDQVTLANCPDCSISAGIAQKTPFLCCCSMFAVGKWFLAKPLLSSGYCIVASFAFVAYQRVCTPHYISTF